MRNFDYSQLASCSWNSEALFSWYLTTLLSYRPFIFN